MSSFPLARPINKILHLFDEDLKITINGLKLIIECLKKNFRDRNYLQFPRYKLSEKIRMLRVAKHLL